MHKFLVIPMALFMSLILGSGLTAFTSNPAFAQNYGYSDDYSYNNSYSDSSYSDSYSPYPTDDKPYECRTGPFEGFFVSSVEFCKHIKFDDKDRKDGNLEIIEQEHKAHQVHQVHKVHKVHKEYKVKGSRSTRCK